MSLTVQVAKRIDASLQYDLTVLHCDPPTIEKEDCPGGRTRLVVERANPLSTLEADLERQVVQELNRSDSLIAQPCDFPRERLGRMIAVEKASAAAEVPITVEHHRRLTLLLPLLVYDELTEFKEQRGAMPKPWSRNG
jgi:hypothetical protein